MTTVPTVNSKPSSVLRLLSVLAALCMVATACGSSSASPVTEASPDGPEYGDSLDEWLRSLDEEQDGPSNALGADGTESGNTPESDYVELPDHEQLEWEDLVPAGYSADDVYSRYQDQLDHVEFGSPEADALYDEMLAEQDTDATNEDLDGVKIQLAGFVAPITFEDDLVTEFLLVPYFGACIHVPPPPPNQTIMVTLDKDSSMTLEDSWGAVWVAGTLKVAAASTDLAEASYTIDGASSGIYDIYDF